eukprot:m.256314 g.256314  ORF g.256314 m.256314 type:complete len:445 (-) comp17563_c0_seq3:106-1440(-)
MSTSESTSKASAAYNDALRRKQAEKKATQVLFSLCEPNITADALISAVEHIQPQHYDELVEEMVVQGRCGYVLCTSLLNKEKVERGKYRVDYYKRRVVDVSEAKQFCSRECFAASNYYKRQLLTTPVAMRTPAETAQLRVTVLQPAHGLMSDPRQLQSVEACLNPSPTTIPSVTERQPRDPMVLPFTPGPDYQAAAQQATLSNGRWTVRSEPGPDAKATVPIPLALLPQPPVDKPVAEWSTAEIWSEYEQAMQALALEQQAPAAAIPPRPRTAVEPVRDQPVVRAAKVGVVEALQRWISPATRAFVVAAERDTHEQSNLPATLSEAKACVEDSDELNATLPTLDNTEQQARRRELVYRKLQQPLLQLSHEMKTAPAAVNQGILQLLRTCRFNADTITFNSDEWRTVARVLLCLHPSFGNSEVLDDIRKVARGLITDQKMSRRSF